MRSKLTIASYIGVALMPLLVSCQKKEEYPITPAIEFVSFVTSGETANLSIKFTDGDGDIGLDGGDTLPPFNVAGDHYHNLRLEYHEQINGVWAERDLGAIVYHARIPVITPKGQNKTLQGEIDYLLEPRYYLDPVISPADTFKYVITLFDRQLHESNTIETPVLIRP